jgi:FkbM family methyltransferase
VSIAAKGLNYLISRPPVLVAVRRVVKRLDPSVYGLLWDAERLDGKARPSLRSATPLVEFLAGALTTHLVVVDVGARWGILDRWRAFLPKVRLVGFDPDEAESERLSRTEGQDGVVEFVAKALGATRTTAQLHLTRSPGCSSLYAPLPELIKQRPKMASLAPVGETTVELSTLDEWFQSSPHDHVDVLKLDTQGSELGVLQGGQDTLATVRFLEVEVEFNPMYAGQPLFSDVDSFLRQRGFVLWRLKSLMHYAMHDASPMSATTPDAMYFDGEPIAIEGRGGQLFWGLAYYVREDVALAGDTEPDWQQAVRDACAAVTFGFTDLALGLLTRARAAAPEAAAAELRRLLAT